MIYLTIEYSSSIVSQADNSLNSSRFQDLKGGIDSAPKNRILLDNLSNWYIFQGEILLPKPLLRKYENILRTNLEDYDVPKEYYYRPEYVSYELYGTTDLWYLLLFINNMEKPDDFTKNRIKVFNIAMLEVINKIFIAEAKNISPRYNPRIINKHIMRDLNHKSDRIIKEETEKVDWMHFPKIEPDNLFSDTFNEHHYTVKKGVLTNNKGELVKPFRLNAKGLFNVPSIYYKNGYSQHNKGRVKLTAGTKYALVKDYNGILSLTLKHRSTGKVYEVMKDVRHLWWEEKLIADYRSMDNTGKTSISTDKIVFDDSYGDFVNGRSTSNIASYNGQSNIGVVAAMKFVAADPKTSTNLQDESLVRHPSEHSYNTDVYNGYFSDDYSFNVYKRHLDLSRIEHEQFLTFNMEYSFKIPQAELAKIEAFSYIITLTYEDNSTERSSGYITGMNHVYDTQGLHSYLKFSMLNPKYKDHRLTGIDFAVVAHAKSNLAISCDYKVWKMYISSELPENFLYQFTVPSSGWYDIDAKYVYTYNGNRTVDGTNIPDAFLYDKEKYAGILFKPFITTINEYDTIDSAYKEPEYVVIPYDEGRTAGVRLSNPFTIDNSGNKNTVFREYHSNNVHLPTRYVLTVRLTDLSVASTGGSFAFLFNDDPLAKKSYMLWITGEKNNPLLPEYNLYDSYDIAPSGFYELDYDTGIMHPIWDQDTTEYVKLDDGFYKDFIAEKGNAVIIKIVHKENRIRLFFKKDSSNDPGDNNYDYDHPMFSFIDNQNLLMHKGIGFLSYFASCKFEVLSFYNLDTDD